MKNQIQIGRANFKTNKTKLDIDFLDGFKTDSAEKSRLCSGICTGTLLVKKKLVDNKIYINFSLLFVRALKLYAHYWKAPVLS